MKLVKALLLLALMSSATTFADGGQCKEKWDKPSEKDKVVLVLKCKVEKKKEVEIEGCKVKCKNANVL